MISLTIWFCLWLNFFVLAPPSLIINHNQSPGNATLITSHLSNTNSEMFVKRRKIKLNRTITEINLHHFDINSYRSSWKFVDKTTIRVRFRFSESFFQTITFPRFLVRHLHTNHIQTYDKPHELINSTLTIYLHNRKHGRHIVCLLLYKSNLMINPQHIFCQDIVFNFQKYGHHDHDLDEHGNTFVFLLTQYSIVLGILCILQLVHAARKRRFLKTIYDKANALYHHHHPQENKSTGDPNQQTHALEYLIYNLNRNALHNMDQDDINSSLLPDHQIMEYDKYLKLSNRLNRHSIAPLVGHRRSLITTDLDEEIFDENDFDIRPYEERSISYKSLSHILEENKPWMASLTNNGSIKHSIISSEPLQNTRCT